MNKQPLYHQATILFTATRELTTDEVQEALMRGLAKTKGVIKDSIVVEECDAEAGDPADLM